MIYHLYRRPKKNGSFWMDLRVNDCRYREPLGTRDRNEAGELMQKRIEQLKTKAPDPAKRSKSYGSMDVKTAIETYSKERRAQVSPRMVAYWKEQIPALAAYFKEIKLKKITLDHMTDYQSLRMDEGKAPKTINGQLSVLRQVLTHAKLWYRFKEDYKALRNDKLPVGRALTEMELSALFETAKSRPDWRFAYTAATMAFFLGMRACEIRKLRWRDVDLTANLLDIRHSKTPSGYRTPTLNEVCRQALTELYADAKEENRANPEHFVFPAGGTDPNRAMAGWRSAWRSLRHKAARNDEGEVVFPGLESIRFHDGRHCAITTLAEKGVPDWVIQAQVGHIDARMMKTYSHVRRQALNAAAAALEPTFMRQSLSPEAELVN
jgi:integrase